MGTAYEEDLDVEFGGVGFGHETARLGVKIDRGKLDLEDADRMFAGKRCEVEISLLNRNDRGQKRLEGMEDNTPPTIVTVADVKGFRVSPTEIGAGLTFNKASIAVGILPAFANETGTLKLTVMGEIPEDEAGSGGSSDDGGDDEDAAPTVTQKRVKGGRNVTVRTPGAAAVTAGDPHAKKSLQELVKHGMTKKKMEAVAEACGGKTIGHFEVWMNGNPHWHRDIKGMGEEWLTKLQDAHLAFRQQNPVPTEDDAPTVLDGPEAATESETTEATEE